MAGRARQRAPPTLPAFSTCSAVKGAGFAGAFHRRGPAAPQMQRILARIKTVAAARVVRAASLQSERSPGRQAKLGRKIRKWL